MIVIRKVLNPFPHIIEAMQIADESKSQLAIQIANLFDVDERAREEQKVRERIGDYNSRIGECRREGKGYEADRLEQERDHVRRIHGLYKIE